MSEEIIRHPSLQVTTVFGMSTASPQMLKLFELVRRVARTDSSVLIRGETGSGKELVAQMLHAESPRKRGPFRAINCATLTPELLASELFGHVRGAFTGAVRERRGLFELADGGSVFLDEIAEIPLDIQARLLRVLQERTFVPLGGTQPVKVDVRIISATHRSLRDEIAQGRFREDLMYRVRVVPLFLPRLADRAGDVEALMWQFIDRHNNKQNFRQVDGVEASALQALLNYSWPGNVRELSNVIEYAFAVGEGPNLSLNELTPELQGLPPPNRRRQPENTQDLERTRLMEALKRSGGRKGEAANILGISRSTLWRKLREFRIVPGLYEG